MPEKILCVPEFFNYLIFIAYLSNFSAFLHIDFFLYYELYKYNKFYTICIVNWGYIFMEITNKRKTLISWLFFGTADHYF